jgi:predicted kinase
MTKPTLYMMMGLPGAGKTTIAQHIADLTGATLLSSDVLRRELFAKSSFTQAEHDELYAELDHRMTELLQTGQSVVYDANLNRRTHRDEKRQLAEKLGIQARLIWVQTPEEMARQRRVDHEPQHDLIPEHETPGQMFDRIAQAIEEPAAEESATVIDGRDVSPSDISHGLGI